MLFKLILLINILSLNLDPPPLESKEERVVRAKEHLYIV